MPILFVAAGGTAVIALRLLSRIFRRPNTNENQDDHFFADDDAGSSSYGSYLSRGAGHSGASRSTTSARGLCRGSCDYEQERPANERQQAPTHVTSANATGTLRFGSDVGVTVEANDGPSGADALSFRSTSDVRRRAASVRKVHEWDDAGGSADWIPVGPEGHEHSGSSGGGSTNADERNRTLHVSGPHSTGTSPSSSLHHKAAPIGAPSPSRRPLPASQLQCSMAPMASKTSELQATLTSGGCCDGPNVRSGDQQPSLADPEPSGCGAGSSLLGNCSRGSGTEASLPRERSSGTGTATLVSGTGTLTCSSSPNASQCTETAEQRSESDSEQGPSGSQAAVKKNDRGKTGVQVSSAASVAVEVLAAGKADQVAMLAAGSGRATSGAVTRTFLTTTSAGGHHRELPLALRSPAPPVVEPAPLPPTILPTRAPDPDRIHAMQMQVETLRLQHLQRQAAALLAAPATNRTSPLLASVSTPIRTASVAHTSGVVAASGRGSSSGLSPYHQVPQIRSVTSVDAASILARSAEQGVTAAQESAGRGMQSSSRVPPSLQSSSHNVTRQSTSLGSWLPSGTQPVQQPQTAYLQGYAVSGVSAGNGGSNGRVLRSARDAAAAALVSGQQFQQQQQQSLQAVQQQVGPAAAGELPRATWPQRAVASLDASGAPTHQPQAETLRQQPQQQYVSLQHQQQLQPVRHTSPPALQVLPPSPAASTQRLQWPDAAIQEARMGTLQRPAPPEPAPQTFMPTSLQQHQQQQQGVRTDPLTRTANTPPLLMLPAASWETSGSRPGAATAVYLAGLQSTTNIQSPSQPQTVSRLSPELEAIIAAAAAAASSSHHPLALHHSVSSQLTLSQEAQRHQPQQHHKHQSPSSSPPQALTQALTSAGSSPSLSSLPGGDTLLASPPSFRYHLNEPESVKRMQDWLNNTPTRLQATASAPVPVLMQGLVQVSTSNGGTETADWRASEPSSPLELRPHPQSFTGVSTAMGLVMSGSGVPRTELSVTQAVQQPRLQASPSSRYGSPVMLRENSPSMYGSRRRSRTGTSSHGSRHTSIHGSHRHRSSARRAREQQVMVQQKLIEQDSRPASPLAQYSARLMQEAVEKVAPIPRMPNGGAFFVPLKHEIRMELSSERPSSRADTISRQTTSTGFVTAKAPSSPAGPVAGSRRQ